MIKRNRYSVEFKEKIGRELALGQIGIAEVSKREGISIQTLSKWKSRFGFDGNKEENNEKQELLELRKKVAAYESALGEMAFEIHLLKKLQKYSYQQMKKRSLSGTISPSTLESGKVVGFSK